MPNQGGGLTVCSPYRSTDLSLGHASISLGDLNIYTIVIGTPDFSSGQNTRSPARAYRADVPPAPSAEPTNERLDDHGAEGCLPRR